MDYSSQIEKGRNCYNNYGHIRSYGNRNHDVESILFPQQWVKDILDNWGKCSSNAKAEIFALAIYEVLGSKLGLQYPIHRDGIELRFARSVSSVLSELGMKKREFFLLCVCVARIYGYTQASINTETVLCRGISGDHVDAYDPNSLRILESWSNSYYIAENFSQRINSNSHILNEEIHPERIFVSYEAGLGIVNEEEEEYLIIN